MATTKHDDFGVSEVQDAFADAQEKGYFGDKVDPRDNSEHSLASGPDAPPVHEEPTEPRHRAARDKAAPAAKED